jgi:UPF0042 nucleotide-binding protein
VDNLPPEMIRALVEVFSHEGSKVERAAVVCDVRTGDLFEGLSAVLDGLDELEAPHRFIFLDAGEETLLTRYKETGRRHPLAPRGGVSKGIALERGLLAPLKEKADLVIETDELKAAGLRRRITDELLPRQGTGRLAVTFQSFGFKHGPPRDADLAFDVRFLPNPHYVPGPQAAHGLDPRWWTTSAATGAWTPSTSTSCRSWTTSCPSTSTRARRTSSSAIGCTGGKHRSVAISEHLAARYRDSGDLFVDVVHRDIDKR